jgi:hypothetical protein
MKGGRRGGLVVLGACLVAGLWSGAAFGQTVPAPPSGPAAAGSGAPQAGSPITQAETLFNEGVALLEAGSYAAACAKLEESHRLDPAPGTLFNIGSCENKQGHFAAAARRWREVFAMLPEGHSRRQEAKERAEQAEAKAGRLMLRLGPQAPKGTSVALDARVLDAEELSAAIVVDPGTHRILVSAPGHESRDFTADAASGDTREVVVMPGPPRTAVTPPGPAGAKPSAGPVATSHRRRARGLAETGPGFFARHTTSLAVLGGAAVPAAVAVGLGVEIISGHYSTYVKSCGPTPTCPPDAKGALDGQVTAINVLVGVAGAAGVAAGVLFILEEIKPASRPGTQVSLAVGPTGASLTLRR